MREIVYSESGNGIFTPDLTPAQKRAATRLRKQRAAHREDIIASLVGYAGIGLAILMIIVSIWIGHEYR